MAQLTKSHDFHHFLVIVQIKAGKIHFDFIIIFLDVKDSRFFKILILEEEKKQGQIIFDKVFACTALYEELGRNRPGTIFVVQPF